MNEKKQQPYSLLKEDFKTENYKEISSSTSENEYSENTCLQFFAISSICFGISNFQIKYIQIAHRDIYDPYSFGLWRTLSLTLWSYLLIRYKNLSLVDITTIQNKFWFGIRTIGQFISMVAFIFSLKALRSGTAGCFVSMNPAVVVICAIIILKEKFHIRYVIGIMICFSGVLLILLNEKGGNVDKSKESDLSDIVISSLFGLVNTIMVALLTVSSKFLNNENIGHENQCFYIGVSNVICSLFCIILNMKLAFKLSFIIASMINSLIFFIATLLLVIGVKGVDLNKTTPLNYFSLVMSTLLSVIFLGEPIFATDVVGSLVILGYNVYNSVYPIK